MISPLIGVCGFGVVGWPVVDEPVVGSVGTTVPEEAKTHVKPIRITKDRTSIFFIKIDYTIYLKYSVPIIVICQNILITVIPGTTLSCRRRVRARPGTLPTGRQVQENRLSRSEILIFKIRTEIFGLDPRVAFFPSTKWKNLPEDDRQLYSPQWSLSPISDKLSACEARSG